MRGSAGAKALLVALALAALSHAAHAELDLRLDIGRIAVRQLRWDSLLAASMRSAQLADFAAAFLNLKPGARPNKTVTDGVDNLMKSLLEEYPAKMKKWGTLKPVARAAKKRAMMENVARIAEINARNALQKRGWFAHANEFLDWSAEERRALTMGPKWKGEKLLSSGTVPFVRPNLDLFSGVDWRERNKVGPIRHQYSCGSCWAFAAASTLESKRMIILGEDFNASKPLHTLSPQQLTECVFKPRKAKWSGLQYNSDKCTGGFSDEALDYAWQFGIVSEDKYPYTASAGGCSLTKIAAALLSGQVYNPRHPYPASSGFVRVTTKSADALKAAVHAQPVAIYLRAESDFHDYGGGVYDTACSGTNLNHAVTLVGWRDPAVVPGVASHWIVRNSWGTSWGEGGYMRLKMDTVEGSEGLCRSQAYAYYPNTSV